MTVNITPLHDRVLIRRLEEKETAKSGWKDICSGPTRTITASE